MRHVGFVFLVLALATAGCGGVKQAPPAEPPKSASQAVAPTAPASEPSSAPPPSPPSSPSAPSPPVAATPPVAAPPAQPPTRPSPAPSEAVAKAAPPDAKAPAKAAAPAAPAPKKEAAAADATKQQPAAPLDLASLETRLKNTQAIGVLTKLSLKNQVDDLLNQFRAFYQGKLKTTLAELRRPYDLLILKVLSLLQDKDPPLATDLAASREAIWGILSDPVKFAKI
jgi:cytoskeletal protein RodZ